MEFNEDQINLFNVLSREWNRGRKGSRGEEIDSKGVLGDKERVIEGLDC